MEGFVDTVYGRLPGCPICGLIPLSKPLVCEHGVTTPPAAEISLTINCEDPEIYQRLLMGEDGR